MLEGDSMHIFQAILGMEMIGIAPYVKFSLCDVVQSAAK
jgi:hypothetical protein